MEYQNLPRPNLQLILWNLNSRVLIEVLSTEANEFQVLHYMLEEYIVYMYHFTETTSTSEDDLLI